MKKLSFLALAAAGLLLGACSDKEEALQVTSPDDFQDGAYIGIALSLPSADNTTRANDDLSNGIEAEFAVKNATLYIFKGTSEADAVFVDYVTLGTKYNPDTQSGINPDEWGVQQGVGTKPGDDTDAGNDPDEGETNITSTSLNEATKISNELAAQIKGDASNDYFAYVILNHNGQIPTMTKGTTTFQEFSRAKFSKIGADIALEQNIWTDGMLMTSAPICSVKGGQAAPVSPKYSTLVPLDKSKIFQSAAQAKKEPAACVYVERAAVKITVEKGTNVEASTIDGLAVAIDGWKVINTEEKYYNTRQINFKSTEEGTSKWATEDWGGYNNEDATPSYAKFRFVSYLQFLPTLPAGLASGYEHTVGFRTFFAADPHYDFDCVAADATVTPAVQSTLKFTTAEDDRPWIAPGKHAYTTENTFDVKHQTWRNTTMVTVKAHLSGNPAFYTIGNGGQTMYTTVADVQAVLHNLIMNDADVATAVQALLDEYGNNNPGANIKSGLTVTLDTPTDAITGLGFTVAQAFTKNGAALTPSTTQETTLSEALDAAIAKFIHPEDPKSTTTPKALDVTKYTDAVLLSYYKKGEMFYNVKIQHFGQPETPWGGTDVVANGAGVDVNEIYFNTLTTATPTDAAITAGQSKFLGRYGVVRDNWYKLTLDQVTKIGSATPEDPSIIKPDTPDDEIENFISVHVHIVPWVLRSQNVVL